MMDLKPEVIIIAAAVLLASQVAVIIVLIVLCKKFKTLENEVHKYKVKQNRTSLSKLVVKDPKETKNRPRNEYVDGKRHPQTLVRTNSKESIEYVPTPLPGRRSKILEGKGYEMDVMQGAGNPSTSYYRGENANTTFTQDQDEIYGNQVVIDMEKEQTISGGEDSTVINDPSTPCIEEININTGYTPDTEEIYGNQLVIDMAKTQAYSIDEQTETANVDRSGPKSKKRKKNKTSQKTKAHELNTSLESERTTEVWDSSYEGGDNQPIYENLRGQIASTAQA